MKTWRLAIVVTLAFVAAVAGVWIGRTFIPAHQARGSELHEVLHHELKLDGRQEASIDQLEQQFAVRRRALELEMRAHNARLAEAIAAEHRNGPRVVAAIDASHRTMGELQKETLSHIFAMRRVLNAEQAATFDRAVVRSLTADGR